MTVAAKLTKADLQCCYLPFEETLVQMEVFLHIGCLVENHIPILWTMRFNDKQVKQKPSKVCITWKVVWLRILHLSSLRKHQHDSSNPVYHQHQYLKVHSFVFSKKVFHWELLEFALYLKPPILDSFSDKFITRFYTNWSVWIRLWIDWDAEKLWGEVKKF